ncbi:GNAT family N-acetyltransferase [Odoribacter sp. OttesenSCG-928-J03]|nr:GNAT family N-acetyltransferase [Odoribacter sp. OttesenSCG-928-J03]MDL2330626.1 GNAT family N-acetyltransferase [Odoribacter sp. OttesenSCG-928-A06]
MHLELKMMKNEKIKQDYKRLWHICFQDTDEFTEFYFKRKFTPENCSTIYENGQLQSALLMLPYSIHYYGEDLEASYVSGACTLPEARGKGSMRKLLSDSLKTMQERGFAFSVLIPQEEWLYDYYQTFDYMPVFQYSLNVYFAVNKHFSTNVKVVSQEEANKLTQELYEYLNKEMRKYALSIQHDLGDFKSILEDLYISNGKLLIYRHPDGQLGGIAFTVNNGSYIKAYEVVADSIEEKQVLLTAAACIWENPCIKYKDIAQSSLPILKGGMARIINAKKVLDIYASKFPEQTGTVRLTDNILPSNNGYYQLSEGKCIFSEYSDLPVDYKFTIRELTEKLFPNPAYMSLMLD